MILRDKGRLRTYAHRGLILIDQGQIGREICAAVNSETRCRAIQIHEDSNNRLLAPRLHGVIRDQVEEAPYRLPRRRR